MKGILDTSDEEWDGVTTTNVRGFFVHSRAALPALAERDASAIVNMASISGLIGLPLQAAYCASKGAIVQLTRQLAVEFAPQGVRVNAVAPGAIETPFLLDVLPPDPEPILAEIAASDPIGRNSQPAEIAEVVPVPRVVEGGVHDRRDRAGRWGVHGADGSVAPRAFVGGRGVGGVATGAAASASTGELSAACQTKAHPSTALFHISFAFDEPSGRGPAQHGRPRGATIHPAAAPSRPRRPPDPSGSASGSPTTATP